MIYFKYPQIICSYQNADTLKNLFPKREVLSDRNAPNDTWYYFPRKGTMRTVEIKSKSIWVGVYEYCELLGMDVFTGMIKRKR